jgi:acetylornithine deacetylase/succinyl-diaminopimelate desuccinylase-like protein
MAPLLERLASRIPSYELTPESAAMLAGLGGDGTGAGGGDGGGDGGGPEPGAALARIRERSPELATLVEPTLGVTFAPTKIRASQKINVIPSSAEMRVDCRVPPGLGEEAVHRAIAEVLGDEREGGFEIAFTERTGGNSSPADSPLMDAIRAWIAERDPGARVLPTVLTGFSDSRAFRAAFPDAVVYGFCPARHQSLLEAWPLIHGADERIDARDVAFAAEFFCDLCVRLLG